jgi:hypothetical protein
MGAPIRTPQGEEVRGRPARVLGSELVPRFAITHLAVHIERKEGG